MSPGLGVREQGQAKGLSEAASRKGCCPLTCWDPSPFLLFLRWMGRMQWMGRMHHFLKDILFRSLVAVAVQVDLCVPVFCQGVFPKGIVPSSPGQVGKGSHGR